MTEFLMQWFGRHVGREVFYADIKTRDFLETPRQLEDYVVSCKDRGLPAFVSVQPYRERDQPFGLEKLFYEFDCEEDFSKVWKDAKILAETLTKYYAVQPFIKFSGRKGYHLDAFLTTTVQFPTWRMEFVKAVYDKLQRKILKGLELETLDSAVLGDIKRLERVPFSIYEATSNMCVPVDLDGKIIPVESLEPYRQNGLETKILEAICKEVMAEEKWRRDLSEKRQIFPLRHDGEIRLCFERALTLPLHKGEGPKMRLGIVTEHLCKGVSVDQVVNLFSSQVDFNEKKTRYFVEDAANKGYKPFKCKTIRELGFCLGDACSLFTRKKENRG